AGGTVVTAFDSRGQMTRYTDCSGRSDRILTTMTSSTLDDEQGQMCSRIRMAGGTVVTAFDSRGQMTRYTDCSGRSDRILTTM
ncbi:hypothetical protein V5H41_28445, partial [Salmonella enterica]